MLPTSVLLFAERVGLQQSKKVEEVQEIYLSALREYVAWKRPGRSTALAQLLMRLTELRTLGHQWADLIYSLKMQKRHMPELLSEIWDYDSM